MLHNAVNWNPWSTKTCTTLIGIMIVPWEKKPFPGKNREKVFDYTGEHMENFFFLAWLFAQTIFCSSVWHSFSQAILEQKCKHFSPLNKRFSMSNTPLSSVHSVQKNPINCLVHNATQLVWISTFSRENSSFCISVIYCVSECRQLHLLMHQEWKSTCEKK